MLISNLIGGLGNQMFQYAFGKSLSIQRELSIKFDLTELLDRAPKEQFTFRDFELGIFNASVASASAAELNIYKHQPISLVERISYRLARKIKKVTIFAEKQDYVFDTTVFQTSSNTYFNGYWQNERYFLPCEEVIRQDFVFKQALSGENAKLAVEIAQTNAVSIHVRRGDYVSVALSNQFHGTCSPEYYQKAVQLICQRVDNPTLFVFSDEPDWVKENLVFGLPTTYISHNVGANSFEDMRLMSLCKHNIIANSSFSWWGAWLNANPEKIVIAPQRWIQKEIALEAEIIPHGWVKL